MFFSTIDGYVNKLRNLASSCEFGGLCDALIMTQVIRGLQDENLRLRLLREDELTLAKTVNICRASEMSKVQAKQIAGATGGGETSTANIAAIKRKPNFGAKKKFEGQNSHKFSKSYRPAQNQPPASVGQEGPCPNCGTEHPNSGALRVAKCAIIVIK